MIGIRVVWAFELGVSSNNFLGLGENMKKSLSVILLLFSQLALAQSQQSTEQEAESTETIRYPQQVLEEIIVVGERTFISIRYQIERAEDNLYQLFNELNSSDNFDLVCRNRKRLSHIPRRECEPKFLTRARQANAVMAMAAMRGGGGVRGVEYVPGISAGNSAMYQYGLDLLQSERELKSWEGRAFEALNAEMLRLATENQEFLESLMRVGKLKNILQEEREKVFGKE